MKNRRPANSTGSKKSFTHHAMKVHKKNMPRSGPMRGGIRL